MILSTMIATSLLREYAKPVVNTLRCRIVLKTPANL